MQIEFSPMRHKLALTLERQGDQLMVNGEVFDFSQLPEGGELPADAIDSAINRQWFTGPVTRENGVLHLKLLLPHGANAPQDTLFPATLTVDVDGPIALPAYAQPAEGAA